MKIVYIGSGTFGIDCLNYLVQSSHELKFIVTGPAAKAGRGLKARATSVARWAESHVIAFMETNTVNSRETIERIASYQPDLIIVIAFGYWVGKELTNLPPKGAINVHASLLPKYRGAAPINRVLINGEQKTGISIIELAQVMDSGAVLGQVETGIEAGETAGELHGRLAALAGPLLVETVDKIAAGTAVYSEQDGSKATSAPKLRKSDGFLDFGGSANVLERKIRGFWPWPASTAMYVSRGSGKSVRVSIATAKEVVTSNPDGLEAGTLDKNLNVICGENGLAILKLQPAGGRLMDFEDFVNGRQSEPGDMFVKIEE